MKFTFYLNAKQNILINSQRYMCIYIYKYIMKNNKELFFFCLIKAFNFLLFKLKLINFSKLALFFKLLIILINN